MIPFCNNAGVGLVPWSPIAGGILARPWREDEQPTTARSSNDGTVLNMIKQNANETDKQIVQRVEELAKKKGVSMAQIATAWNLAKGVHPIMGLSSKERIDQAIASLKVQLDEEEIKYLEEPYQPKPVTGYST